MESRIISGDFPINAVLKPTGFLLRDISIIWSEGFSLKAESLKGKIDRLKRYRIMSLMEFNKSYKKKKE